MLKLKKSVLIILAMLVIALVLPVKAFASDGTITIAPGGTPTPSVSATPNLTAQATPSQNVTTTPSTKPNLPKTGIENYTGLIVTVLLFGGSAVFAYKKIKEYNKF